MMAIIVLFALALVVGIVVGFIAILVAIATAITRAIQRRKDEPTAPAPEQLALQADEREFQRIIATGWPSA
jgi:Na+-transporting methylmalonyl-CoA/oxaloacetate decarboxylase gamma subunit